MMASMSGRRPRQNAAVRAEEVAPDDDAAQSVAGCELVLEALVARRRVSRSDGGRYTRAVPEPRRRPNQDFFGGGLG